MANPRSRLEDSPAAASEEEGGRAPAAHPDWLGSAAVLEQIPDGVIVADESGRIVFVNEAAARLHGVKTLGVAPEGYSEAYHLFTLDGRAYPPGELPLARAVRGETVTDARWCIRHPDGAELVAIGTARPFLDSEGRRRGAILTLRDDSARHRAELALAESEARFRTIADCAPSPVWVTGPSGIEFVNHAYVEIAQRPEEELLGDAWIGHFHEEDIAHILALRDAAWRDGAPYQWEARFRRAGGAWVWVHASCAPRFDASGDVLGYVGMAVDITESRRAEAELRASEQHLRLMVEELNHRVKNTLAIVQGLAHQSFRGADVPAEVRGSFEGRLTALATAHNLLTRANWESADLHELVREVLRVHGPERFSAAGPAVKLDPKTAVSLTMALHELCTNAGKYGAFSQPSGTVRVCWTTDGDRLSLTWEERGGPPVSPPARRGFGTRMIERALAGETGGHASLEFRPEGLVCRIEVQPAARGGEEN